MKKCLIIHYKDLPRYIFDRMEVRNDSLIYAPSEWSHDWSTLSRESIKDYYIDQEFEGTLEEFIADYRLELDLFLIDNYAEELQEVDEVLIKVCW